MLTLALTEAFFRVTDASDYFEALWQMDESQQDLVILNLQLPSLDGWEVCSRIHWSFGVPVILLGNDKNDEAWIRAVQAGADFYLKEPFNCLELTARIKAILRR